MTGTGKQVQDVYATLGKDGTSSHPFVTYMRFTDGSKSQEIQHRTLRDCLISGNSMLSALSAMNIRYETVNVVFDPRFDRA